MNAPYAATWESVKTHVLPSWYDEYKFGIFIHWGIYSVPAFAPVTWQLGEVAADENWFCNNPYAEWYFNSINVKRGPTYEYHLRTYGEDFSYNDFLPSFDAKNWQPAQWAALFKKAGARYVVLTSKHHDGFCLFPSQHTDYHSANYGPKRDIVGELSTAVRDAGLKMGLYYSGAIDWTYSPAPIFTEAQNMSNTSPTYAYADYAFNQVRELIDNYQPSILWNDIGWVKQGEHMLPSLFAHYYNHVEEGLTNDRWNGLWHDFICKEYQHGQSSRTQKWEMCRGLGLSFGYNQNEREEDYISVRDLVALLVEVVANNGNLLLNVGPKADGTLPAEQIARLEGLGQWLAVNGQAIYGSRPDLESAHTEGLTLHYTQTDDWRYVFVVGLTAQTTQFTLPFTAPLTALNSAVRFSQTDNHIQLEHYEEDWHTLVFKYPTHQA